MQFAERAECFARHDEPDIADIVEGCHDIVSPIVPVLVDSRFPRDQFVSNILQILVILEEENGRELGDIIQGDGHRHEIEIVGIGFYRIEIGGKSGKLSIEKIIETIAGLDRFEDFEST